MIPKPNKPKNMLSSYRPISLLTTFSKIYLRRLLLLLERQNIIPDQQFGFHHKHGTSEQCHRIVIVITDALENKRYCSAVFLDVQQAFDRVWHLGLRFKIKKVVPAPYFFFFNSYLSQRHFYFKSNDERLALYEIRAGIPQGSVLGSVLYYIFTADIPVTNDVIVATYADDTAIAASSQSL